MSQYPTNKEVLTYFFDIYNNKNYEDLHDYFAADYYDHGLPQVRSVEDAIAILKLTHTAFPDIQVVINDLIEEGEKIAFRGYFTATHLGEFVGIPASGARVEFEALEIFKFENHKVTESWGYWPMPQILEQIKQHIDQN